MSEFDLAIDLQSPFDLAIDLQSPFEVSVLSGVDTYTLTFGTFVGLATVAVTGSATDLVSGILPTARFNDASHGSRAGGSLHANVIAAGAAGFMTGTDKTKLDGISGSNTGDQTSIVGLTGTKAQFDTAVTDGNISYIGDAPTAHTHLLAVGATDVTITAANLNILDDGLNTALHFHDADRARAVHTGTQVATTISDFNATSRAQTEAELFAGTNVTITPAGSGATRTLTIAATGGAATIAAGEALGGHRVVTAQGLHCMSDTLSIIVGITVTAGSIGTEVEYLSFGSMVENSWSWIPNTSIFAGNNGILTQTEPTGNSRRVAFAITATTIAVDLQPTIYRS